MPPLEQLCRALAAVSDPDADALAAAVLSVLGPALGVLWAALVLDQGRSTRFVSWGACPSYLDTRGILLALDPGSCELLPMPGSAGLAWVVTLLTRDYIVGGLVLGRKRDGEAFSEADHCLLSAAGPLLARTFRDTWFLQRVFVEIRARLAQRPNLQIMRELASLNRRERDVLLLLVQGLRNVDIQDALSISRSTVEFHAKNIYRKIGARSRADAVSIAMQAGMTRRRATAGATDNELPTAHNGVPTTKIGHVADTVWTGVAYPGRARR